MKVDITFLSFRSQLSKYGVKLDRTKGWRYIATEPDGKVIKLKNKAYLLNYMMKHMEPELYDENFKPDEE